MERRAFIIKGGKSIGAIGLGVLGIYSCQSHEPAVFNGEFSLEEVNMINEIGEIIIPITDTPGAKAARVGEFITVVVRDCFSEKEKKEFNITLADINKICNESFGDDFLKCKESERLKLVSKMEEGHGGYKTLKNLIVSAYLSSEIGMTKYFDYHPVPGKYDGCTTVRPW
ncbi:gluconate 2-dehydrogenase subunit 3 family protein [Agriterribacter sp.]|uniref:gluconate 2-dehydrogenase subunit 3 family protein n=1 Tax=Agriterribacter sp. TaxID=2821509 RepID=UPI002B9E8D63|nr:gluconate 2-dehydrogenase subunit 3 family protein [Agriterribacter sp.]HTN07767.1 gluconate 2-dehydrogenase subunit 3 family protein [Agriterribacter sp.]